MQFNKMIISLIGGFVFAALYSSTRGGDNMALGFQADATTSGWTSMDTRTPRLPPTRARVACTDVGPLFANEPSLHKNKELQGGEASNLMIEIPALPHPVVARTQEITSSRYTSLALSPLSLESDGFQVLRLFITPFADDPRALAPEDTGKYLGVTYSGGFVEGGPSEDGTIFEESSNAGGTLYSFSSSEVLNNPTALVRGSDGSYYGIAEGRKQPHIFQYDPGGIPQSILQFDAGDAPLSLVAGNDGFLYGTMSTAQNTGGAIFKLSPTGDFTVLHEFGGSTGTSPVLSLLSFDGSFYGLEGLPEPSIFRISPAGDFSYVLLPASDRSEFSDMIEDGDGDLIVTSPSSNTVLRVTKSGVTTVLHTFSPATEGSVPTKLVFGPDGHVCGVTNSDGAYSAGTIYGLASDGGFLVLHQLDQDTDGYNASALVSDIGRILGLMASGLGGGTLFEQNVPVYFPSPTLLNISTRAQVLNDAAVLIGGFVVPGSVNQKTVLIRALGPSLALTGIENVLNDPVLELHDPNGFVTVNDNWKDTQESEIEATGIAPVDDAESAILATIAPGAYTAIVRAKDGGTGIGMIEVYDLDQSTSFGPSLINMSSRGSTGTGDNVMIAGVIVGEGNAGILIRALGPELAAQGVAGVLQNPTLDLYDQDGALLVSNDDWKDTQQTEIEATTLPPTDDREAAILANLPSGSYTAIVRGKDGTSGIGLVEVYDVGL